MARREAKALAEPEGLRKHGFSVFSSSLRSDRSLRSRPKSAVADFVEQGFRMPLRLRHPLLFGVG
jgi:hypothetical protein